ncbi:Filamin repeat domain containing protein [Acanthamoeba castellanii str. Neff]|uniref:Filamin repeat domain containing protein n=1 Tax=Acanthamoeba castellanii (strain ATCC 30010 / Neff) TaxID=1257118 RepID=L8H8F4_ACACF|nr:Filamin repeat domain containing protein [Acanthamoeba castellanii str. Neff]ELR21512.1 Filamin repeat domain containing protein [Acanthamoeba castellanii str. Neff]
MGSRWAPLLVLLALVLSSGSAATGPLEPLQCPYQNEEAPHKPQPPITTCSWYADNACCDHRDTNDLIRWLYVSQKSGGQDGTNGECLSLLHVMRCGLLCSPAQADFVEKTNPMQSSSKLKLAASPQMPYTYRLCSSFCDRLYAACSDEGMREVEEAEAGPTWDAAMTWDSESSSPAAEEFCKSMAPSDVEIVVVEDIPTKSGDGHKHMCFNGRPTTASAKTSFAYGQGLTADFAGRWSFFIQAVDAQGEEIRDGGDHFMARVQQIPEGVSIDVEQTDMSNGLYSVSFVLSDPGRYQISVLLEGQHVSNSPAYTTIVDHNKCLVPKTNRRAQRPEPQLKRCKWYNEKACCTAEKDRSVDQWMAKAINPLFKVCPLFTLVSTAVK